MWEHYQKSAPIMTDRMIEIAFEVDKLMYEYYKISQEVNQKSAVVWIRNNDNGHVIIFTRSEYAEDMINAIPNL